MPARKEIELAVCVDNKPGTLAQLLKRIAEDGINILAYCSYTEHDRGMVLLVTSAPEKAAEILERNGYKCKKNPVVMVEAADHVGAVAELGAKLWQSGVNILYSYASSAGGDNFFAVFKTQNDDRAVQVLQS
jgi:hypothetical protein